MLGKVLLVALLTVIVWEHIAEVNDRNDRKPSYYMGQFHRKMWTPFWDWCADRIRLLGDNMLRLMSNTMTLSFEVGRMVYTPLDRLLFKPIIYVFNEHPVFLIGILFVSTICFPVGRPEGNPMAILTALVITLYMMKIWLHLASLSCSKLLIEII